MLPAVLAVIPGPGVLVLSWGRKRPCFFREPGPLAYPRHLRRVEMQPSKYVPSSWVARPSRAQKLGLSSTSSPRRRGLISGWRESCCSGAQAAAPRGEGGTGWSRLVVGAPKQPVVEGGGRRPPGSLPLSSDALRLSSPVGYPACQVLPCLGAAPAGGWVKCGGQGPLELP